MSDFNDWEQVTILRKKYYNAKEKKDLKSKALREGNVDIQKKFGAGGNKNNMSNIGSKALDDAEDGGKHETVDRKLSQIIMKGRCAKNLTQDMLANKMCVKKQVIVEYENGQAIPNNQILGKLERILGIILRGNASKWGEPLIRGKKK